MDNFQQPRQRAARTDYSGSVAMRPKPVTAVSPPVVHAPAEMPPAADPTPESVSQAAPAIKTLNISFHKPHLRERWQQVPWRQYARPLRNFRVRTAIIIVALVVMVSQALTILQPLLTQHTYALGQAESQLVPKNKYLASKLQLDAKTGSYNYNAAFTVTNSTTDSKSGGPQIKAVANQDPAKGLQVVDPNTGAQFGMTPQFQLLAGKQDGNRLVYPLMDGTGWVVYTMQATGVKEDVLLDHSRGDTMKLQYKLDLANQGLAAKLQKDGSVAIYGSSLPINGHISTGNNKDASLLEKARKNVKKDKYLFALPAPTIFGPGHVKSKTVQSYYQLEDQTLTTVTTGLKNTSYPLDIDPAVTVIGASDLFRDTNAESNVDLDSTTGNIARGKVTGGVVTTAWTSSGSNLTTARWLAGGAVYDDYAYVAGGAAAGATTNTTSVEYAAISKASPTIGAWAATTALPTALSRFQLIAYNGYMYAIGGSTTNTTCTTDSNKIYFTRIQTNGQLSSTWTDNSTVTGGQNLPASLCGFGATIFNNKLYIAGGRTSNLTSSGSTAVYYTSINPDGSITTTFTTEDSVLPAARYDADLKVYNGYLYLIAGELAGTVTGTVLVAALDSDGSIYGTTSASWSTTATLNTARSGMGSSLSAVNDGYMYVEGGCNTLNASQTCTTATANTQGDVEVAQINADGTLGSWTSIATTVANYAQIGGSLLFWRGNIYVFAGCTSVSTTAVQCTTATNTQQYDTIATAGQISPVKAATTSGFTAVWGHGMAIVNGYIFVIGGCNSTGGTSCQGGVADVSAAVQVAKINADGTTGAWTTTTAIPLAVSGMAVAVYNNYIYLLGGYDYTATSNGSATNRIFYGQVSSTGTIPAWTSIGTGATTTYVTPALARYYSSAVAYRGYIYIFGGCVAGANQTGCSTYYKDVYSAPINSNGSLGSWTTQSQLPNNTTSQAACTAVALMAATVYNGYLYLAGGACSTTYGQSNKIQYATLTNGTVGTVNTATGNMTTDGSTLLPIRRADAYAVNGYLYVVGGHNGVDSSTHGEIQIGKITLSNGNISSNLTPSITKMTARWDARTAYSNGYMYVTGGCPSGAPANTCGASGPSNLDEYFQIYNAGNHGTGTWTSGANNYTTNRVQPGAVAYKGYMYIAGGCTTAFSVAAFSGGCTAGNEDTTTSYAPLKPDGTIGAWSTDVAYNLPAGRYGGCMVAVGGYLYYLGGQGSANVANSTVYYSQIGANGIPGAWATATKGIGDTGSGGAALVGMSCDVFNNYIYVTGGLNNTSVAEATAYHTPSMTGGGDIASNWTAMTSFTTARENASTVIAGGYLYVMGGDDKTKPLLDVQYEQLNPSTGDASGSWGFSGDLPTAASGQGAFAANGYIYLFGGRTAAASCLGNGSTAGFSYIASVNNTGLLGSWSLGANSFTTPRFAAAAAFYNGYYYLMGGDDCTNIITTNVIQQGGEQSQAMKTQFSKYADLNGDGKPEKLVIYLTNAVNNGVDIEEWKMIYQSSREAANTWGANTVVSPLVNQNAYSVNAYDGSGVDQLISRWFYLQFSIDMVRSFSFQDTNQPTVYQYGLHYAPPPSKRLLHGRDFRDQTQQGEDLKL